MTLYINTTQNNFIEIGIKDKNNFMAIKKIKSHRAQAEKLLPAIEKLLKVKKLKPSSIKKIEVANCGGSFTSLRLGVVMANALAYALGIQVTGTDKTDGRCLKVVNPIYDREPEITEKKSENLVVGNSSN